MERGGLHAVDILNTLQLQYRPQSGKAWGDMRQDFMMAPVGVYRAQGMLVSIYVGAVSAEILGHIGFQNSVPWRGKKPCGVPKKSTAKHSSCMSLNQTTI